MICIVDQLLEPRPVADIFLFLPSCKERQFPVAALFDLSDNVILKEFVIIPAEEIESFPRRGFKCERLALDSICSGIVGAVLATVQFISDGTSYPLFPLTYTLTVSPS